MDDQFDSFDVSYRNEMIRKAEERDAQRQAEIDEMVERQRQAMAAKEEAQRQAEVDQQFADQQAAAQGTEGEEELAPSGGFFSDAAAGFVNGIRDAGVSAAQLGLDVATLGQYAGNLDEMVPDVQDRDSATFGITSGLTQFATGFIPAIGIMGQASKLARVTKILKQARTSALGRAFTGALARDTLAGGLADFAVFDPHSARFSDFVEELGVSNPVTEFLRAEGNEDDSALMGRLKNVIEGAGLGAAFDVVLKGLRAAKNNSRAFSRTLEADTPADIAASMKVTHEAVVLTRQHLDEIDRAIEIAEGARRPATDPNVAAAREAVAGADRLASEHPGQIFPATRNPSTGEVRAGGVIHADLLEGDDVADGLEVGFWSTDERRFLTRDEARVQNGVAGGDTGIDRGRRADEGQPPRPVIEPQVVVQPHAEAQAHIDAADLRAGQAGIDRTAALDEVGAPFDEAARQASGIEQARALDPDRVAKVEGDADETIKAMHAERQAARIELSQATDALYALRTSDAYRNLPDNVRAEWELVDQYIPSSKRAADDAATEAVDAQARHTETDAAEQIDRAADELDASANPNRDTSLDEFDADSFNLYDELPDGTIILNEERMARYHAELNKDGSVRKINIGKQIDVNDPVIFRAVSAIFAKSRGSLRHLDVKSLGQIRALNNFNTRRMAGSANIREMADELATFVRQHMGLAGRSIDNKETLATADALARIDAQELADPDRAARLLQNYKRFFKSKADDLAVHVTTIRIMTESARLEALRLTKSVLAGKGNASQADLILAYDNFVQLQNIRDGFAANVGRALQSFNIRVHAVPVLDAKTAARLVDDNGGSEAIVDMARQMEGALEAGPAALEKYINDSRGNFGKMFMEYWLNAILSGPITQTVNLFSNTVVMLWAPMEKLVTGAALKAFRGTDLGLIQDALLEYHGLAEGWRAAFRLSREGGKAVWDATKDQFFKLGDSTTLRARLNLAGRDDVGNVWKAWSGDEAQMIPGAKQYDFDEEAAISSGNVKRALERTRFRSLVKNLDSGTTGGRLIDWIGNVTRLPSRMLTTGDELAKTLNYHMALTREAHKRAVAAGAENVDLYVKELVQNVPKHRSFANLDPKIASMYKELDEIASHYAQKFTFTEPMAAGSIGRSVQNFVTQHPTARFVVPFVRTPTNLLYFAGERTPLLWRKSRAYKAAFEAAGDGLKDTAEYAAMRGRMMIGSGLYITAGMLAYNGVITGSGPVQPEERAALLATGWQPNSIKITQPDGTIKYVSFNRTDPFGLFLGMAATLGEGIGQMTELDIMEATLSMGIALSETLQSKAYFTGLTSLVAALDQPDRYLEAWLQQFGGSLVPNFIGSLNRTGAPFVDIGPVGLPRDDMMREADGVLQAIMAKLPGFSTDLPARRNIFGEPITYAMGFGPDTFSPFMTRESPDTLLNREIQRLVPHGLSVSMNGYKTIEGVELDPNQKDRYIQLSTKDTSRNGVDLREGLTRLIQSKKYQQADDSIDGKQKLINDFISKRRQRGKRELLREDPDLRAKIRLKKRQALAAARSETATRESSGSVEDTLSSILGSNS